MDQLWNMELKIIFTFHQRIIDMNFFFDRANNVIHVTIEAGTNAIPITVNRFFIASQSSTSSSSSVLHASEREKKGVRPCARRWRWSCSKATCISFKAYLKNNNLTTWKSLLVWAHNSVIRACVGRNCRVIIFSLMKFPIIYWMWVTNISNAFAFSKWHFMIFRKRSEAACWTKASDVGSPVCLLNRQTCLYTMCHSKFTNLKIIHLLHWTVQASGINYFSSKRLSLSDYSYSTYRSR